MRVWVFWVLLIVFLLVVVPLIIYGISVNAATKVIAANPTLASNAIQNHLDANGYSNPNSQRN